MALTDIIKRIAEDAEREAEEMVLDAEEEVTRLRHEAEAAAVRTRETVLERARVDAEAEAATLIAGARLRGRDRLVAEKRVLIERVLGEAVERLRGLDGPAYAALIAGGIADVTRGHESLVLSEVDEGRLAAHLPAALAARGLDVEIDGASAGISEGAMLVGDRMRVEVSPESMVATRHAELTALVAEVLFEGAEE